MFNRRMILGSSTATFLAPLIPSLLAPSVSYGQVVEVVIAAAKAMAEIYGDASTYNFQQQSLAALGTIEAELQTVNAKLDNVIALLQAFPAVMKQLLSDSQRDALSAQIRGAESTIFSTLQAARGGTRLSSDDRASLRQLANTQNTTRATLNTYGIISYPFIARAFVSEALALRALKSGSDRRLFEQYRSDTVKDLKDAADAFDALAAAARKDDADAHEIWLKHPNPSFIGDMTTATPTGIGEVFNFYIEVTGDYYSGNRPSSNVTDDGGFTVRGFDFNGTPVKEVNHLHRPTSPFLPYPAGYVWNEGQMGQRLSIVLNTLADAALKGAKARSEAQAFDQHHSAASLLANSVQSMAY